MGLFNEKKPEVENLLTLSLLPIIPLTVAKNKMLGVLF
jgi:hypothetical protein